MNPQQLAQLKTELNEYPQNSKTQFPLGQRRQLVADLLDEIESLRQKQYSFSDISDLLGTKTKLSFKPNTLRKYFFEERAKRQLQALTTNTPSSEPVPLKRVARARSAGKTSSPKAIQGNPHARHIKQAISLAETSGEEERSSISIALAPQPDTQPSQSPQISEPGWDDGNPPAGGLLNEPRFNLIERD